jgi:hypothetical protein
LLCRRSAPYLVMLPTRAHACAIFRISGSSARVRLNDRMRWLQGLELLVTVLLARNRQPPPTVAAGGPHAELAAELLSLPSGLMAMVCGAIVKLKVRRGVACACVRLGGVGHARGADEVRARALRRPESGSGWGSTHLRGLVPPSGRTKSSTVLCRFPMWPLPAPIRSVRALCVVVRG